LLVLIVSASLYNCSSDDSTIEKVLTPTEIFTSTAWLTTGATDQNGNKIPLTDPRASNFVGYAYFRIDGTFNMYKVIRI